MGSFVPTVQLSGEPIHSPSDAVPANVETSPPTVTSPPTGPASAPSLLPSTNPTPQPSMIPSSQPSFVPTVQLSGEPTHSTSDAVPANVVTSPPTVISPPTVPASAS